MKEESNHLVWFVVILLVIIALYALAAVEFFHSTRIIVFPDEVPARASSPRPLAEISRSPERGKPPNPPAGATEPAPFVCQARKQYGSRSDPKLPAGGLIFPHA